MTVTLPQTVAVDGPAGSGKSSVCFVVATDLGYLFIDTGAFYRAVTLAVTRANLGEASEAEIIPLVQHLALDITPDRADDERQYTILMNDEDVTNAVRDPGVEASVSRIAAMGGVRTVLNAKQRELATRGRVIMVGRDIGTVVLPNADLKIYLDASPEARAERRYRQRIANSETANYEEILAALRSRDAYDSGRTVDPLRKADDAHHLHTDHLSIEQVIEQVEQIIHDWKSNR